MITPGQIQIKDTKVLEGLIERNISPLLMNILFWVAQTYGVMVTESYREKKHMNDLHGVLPMRAIDIRSWDYPDGKDREIYNKINTMWQYDHERPKMKCCVWHDSGQGEHFHLQVGYNTRRI